MATPTPDLPTLDSAMTAFKERRNSLLGGAAVLALVVVLALFFKAQMRDAKVGPWGTALADGLPWTQDPEQLALRAEEVKGTEAEPFVRYWQIVVLYENRKENEALALLAEFQKDFPDHYLNTRAHAVIEAGPGELMTPTDRLAAESARLQAWSTQHPLPPDNPAPGGGQTVTLKTDRGDIVLSLYADQSRECAEAFVKYAASLKDAFVVQSEEGKWLDIGHQEDGRAVDVETGEEEFPPYTEAPLSHYRGAVAFSQRPFSEAPHEATIRVWLEREFRDDGTSTVFAKVTAGMDLLEALSKAPRSETVRNHLAEPVKITDVVIAAPDLVTEDAAAPDEETPSEEAEDGN